jgi:hypothetical protein
MRIERGHSHPSSGLLNKPAHLKFAGLTRIEILSGMK